MEENNFKVCDVVQLKSGGPRMTINTNNDGNNFFRCCWFSVDEVMNGTFKSDVLKKVNINEDKTIGGPVNVM